MVEAARYSAVEVLRSGRSIEIRALRPDDQVGLVSAVDRSSAQSLYRRFFGVRRHFTEQEIAFFVNVGFHQSRGLGCSDRRKRSPRDRRWRPLRRLATWE